MGKSTINQAVKDAAQKAWDRHRRRAADLERAVPGLGEMYLRRLTKTLDQIFEQDAEQGFALRTLHDGERRTA